MRKSNFRVSTKKFILLDKTIVMVLSAVVVVGSDGNGRIFSGVVI